jgi:hypothetical protein
MSKKKIILSAGILILVLLGAFLGLVTWVRVRPQSAQAMQSTTVVPTSTAAAGDSMNDGAYPSYTEDTSPGDIPPQLSSWIAGCLSQSGLWSHYHDFLASDPSKRTRLHKDTLPGDTIPVWHVDFSNLPISALKPDGEEWEPTGSDDYPYHLAVRLDGTRICSSRGIPDWIRPFATGIGQGSCSASDDFALAGKWFQQNFDRAPARTELSGDSTLGPASLRVRCADAKSLQDLGLLASLSLDTLEIEHCALGSTEELALQRIHARHLVLLGLRDTVLDLDTFDVSQEIQIKGGNIQWISLSRRCVEGLDTCSYPRLKQGLSISLTDVPICAPGLQRNLVQAGVVLTSPQCPDFPLDLFKKRDGMLEEWKSTIGRDVVSHLLPGSDTLYSPPKIVTNDTMRTMAQGIDAWIAEGPHYPDGFDIHYVAVGRDWIRDGEGEFCIGDDLRTKYKAQVLQEGMTKVQVIKVVGRPAINEGNFLGWIVDRACVGDHFTVGLRAHFDGKGLLDASLLDPTDNDCAD